MKRALALILAVSFILFSFSACGKSGPKVNGDKTDYQVYTYFCDKAENDESTAKNMLARYVAVNSEFKNRELSLTDTQKAEISQSTSDLWHLYGAYYENLGISKQTIYKIETSKAYENSLLAFYYGEKGEKPISEEELKAYFNEHYAAIRFVTGYLFNVDENGATTPFTEEQKTSAVNLYNSVASMVNNGTAIEEAVGALGENTEVHDTVVNSFSEGSFPTGFFNAVKAIEVGKTGAVTLQNYVFLIKREDVFSEEYGYFEAYRSQCLKNMKGEEFNKVIEGWASAYIAE